MSRAARAALARMAVEAGQAIREERLRRRWPLRELAQRAGVSVALAHNVEAGVVAAFESYARLAAALGLRPTLSLTDSQGHASARGSGRRDAEDFVHAAMGECEARALAGPGRRIAIDEPYQHYQFAGRADVLTWDRENLLHIENRTRFPNAQEAAGAYNAKRQYLAGALSERLDLGPRGWRSVTHVIACLWSAEALHVLRLRHASFAVLCPDRDDAFVAWLRASEPSAGITSTLILLDPLVPIGSRRRTTALFAEPPRLDSRYRDDADAADTLRRAA
jgi:transcriptional regulator with XRE-family HTH domain